MENTARKKIVREYYSKRARDYDWQKVRTWKSKQGFRATVLKKVVDALAGLESKPVLEVGVGSGRIGFPLLDKVKPWLVGLDLTKEMLELARVRMSAHKQEFDLILGDVEHLPFAHKVFDAIICVSTMHYFASPERSLTDFLRVLKKQCILVYGDVTMHELDNYGFLNELERELSQAHARYNKPSEIKRLLENHGFRVFEMTVVPYRKSYLSLIEDKGRYFDVKPETLYERIREATTDEKKLYAMNKKGLTLFYTLIRALKKDYYSDLMLEKSVCIKVPKIHGEKAIGLLNKVKIANKELRILRVNDSIYIPLIHQLSKNELETLKKQVPECEVSTCTFPKKKKREATLTDLLEDKLPPHLLASLPRSIDFVGSIAIIELSPELEPHKLFIGEAILKLHKNVQTVFAKAGAVNGVYRLREFNVIAGKPRTDTVHKEYGCKYHVDLARAYFSPRLSNEHNRVASLVKDGETVVDLFGGVGPFSILIARRHENVKVYAVDLNPYAVELLRKNISLNKVYGKVYPLLGDAKQIVSQRLSGVADRVIMNLPERAMEFVHAACKAIKPTGGNIHFYSFASASKTLQDIKLRFVETVQKSGRKVEKPLYSRFVRATAPHEWQIVLDAEIC